MAALEWENALPLMLCSIKLLGWQVWTTEKLSGFLSTLHVKRLELICYCPSYGKYTPWTMMDLRLVGQEPEVWKRITKAYVH